ncbi:aspartate aminotransferase family protein [Desulfovibrio ferrophilus]|uniref:Acetylornithine aminotransferase n=1 Tax=Desulfovibrio ferrophilus TaxID=241368 RepID=A0A2Z6AXV8_9BACT|nr:aspartate aminotransferase family protein [Desulfovibrio ferrophilus]BBD08033.1 acetylornithine/ succinyldiaminopimelateaminotransferase [Desulfovibrio ferrophilus]
MTFEELKEKDSKYICNTYGRYPLAIARGEGCRLYDLDGREYIDLLAGIAVVNLGHGNPALLETINTQYKKLVHVSNLFYQEEGPTLAEKLTATCGADKVFFCNSGAEANEAAIKLARRYMRTVAKRDAYEIITLEGSFHGRTMATMTATGQAHFSKHFQPLPGGFTSVPFGDLKAMAEAIGPQTAGVLIEVIQGEGGIRPLSEEYLLGLEKLCVERDVLFMIDEVQTGMCRTGKFWAHQEFGLAPDIFTTAKPLANGLPMGAMFATVEAAQGFEPGTHATTFGAGALTAAVASKVVDIMLEDDLAGRAAEVGDYAQSLFRAVQNKHPEKIAEVRGRGLMLAIELSCDGADIWKALIGKGFILNLTQGNVLRMLPPLVIEKADMEHFARTLEEILAG